MWGKLGRLGQFFLLAYCAVVTAWLLAIVLPVLSVSHDTSGAGRYEAPSGVRTTMLLYTFKFVLITTPVALVADRH